MDVSTHTQMENRLTEALFKTNLSHYVSRQATVVVLLLGTSQKDRGVPVKTKNKTKKKNKRRKKKRLSDFHSIFPIVCVWHRLLKAFFC